LEINLIIFINKIIFKYLKNKNKIKLKENVWTTKRTRTSNAWTTNAWTTYAWTTNARTTSAWTTSTNVCRRIWTRTWSKTSSWRTNA
jgi:hypothetical protein